jgi:hypothetical protein
VSYCINTGSVCIRWKRKQQKQVLWQGNKNKKVWFWRQKHCVHSWIWYILYMWIIWALPQTLESSNMYIIFICSTRKWQYVIENVNWIHQCVYCYDLITDISRFRINISILAFFAVSINRTLAVVNGCLLHSLRTEPIH